MNLHSKTYRILILVGVAHLWGGCQGKSNPNSSLAASRAGEWHFDSDTTQHGVEHFQRTVGGQEQRYSARTLEPLSFKGTKPAPLNQRDIIKMVDEGAIDKALKYKLLQSEVLDNAINELEDKVKDRIRKDGLRTLGKRGARDFAIRALGKALPMIGLVFVATDFAEGGTEKAIKNAVIPVDLIEEVAAHAESSFDTWLREASDGHIDRRLESAGVSAQDKDEILPEGRVNEPRVERSEKTWTLRGMDVGILYNDEYLFTVEAPLAGTNFVYFSSTKNGSLHQSRTKLKLGESDAVSFIYSVTQGWTAEFYQARAGNDCSFVYTSFLGTTIRADGTCS